jgi:hypothetical protein
MDHSAKAYPVFSRIIGLKEVKHVISSLKKFTKDVAQERLKIIEFYDQYGERQQRGHLALTVHARQTQISQ